MYKIRNKSTIPVYIEEDHNDVLPHIFKLVGSKYLPIEKNVLIHFDSHPDLLVPNELKDDEVHDKYQLFDRLSIENWILPSCYMGIIDTIFWVCPPWANQIRPGKHTFKIGKEINTGNIKITSIENYFLSESITCRVEELENTKDILLIVYKIENEFDQKNKQINLLKQVLQYRDACILDIDLDFFSTRNPFIDLYSRINLYERLKRIYTFDSPPMDMNCINESTRMDMAMISCLKRKQTITKLQDITNYMHEYGEIKSYKGIGIDYIHDIDTINEDIKKFYGTDEVIDWSIIHNAGCTCDDTELPHHVSSKSEIESLLQDMKQILSFLHDKKDSNITCPTVVTIARSSLDDYCPSDQVDAIQTLVEESLIHIFENKRKLEFNRYYLNKN